MLRLCPTRGMAQDLVGEGHVRVNGRRVVRCAQPIRAGDVLTLPRGQGVCVVRLLALPARRGPAEEARRHYAQIESSSQEAASLDEANPSA